MNYGQFLNMLPEASLVFWLLVIFVADFCLLKDEQKAKKLGIIASGALVFQTVQLLFAQPSEAFGGLYVSSAAVNVMKTILAFGTLIVVVMAQSWVNTRQRIAGEFYMLILSTLLGMFVMMSSGNFLLFFLGLEMASVPLACLVPGLLSTLEMPHPSL